MTAEATIRRVELVILEMNSVPPYVTIGRSPCSIAPVPIYRYSGPHDSEPHEVVAEKYERDDENLVTFRNVTSIDGDEKREPVTFAVRALGAVQIVVEG